MRPKKELGQNFLIDPIFAETIATAGEVSHKDTVLEIGPGLGFVSTEIASRAGSLLAVELDGDLIPKLQENLKYYENITLINGDGLKLLRELETSNPQGINKLLSSLPYQITSPVLHSLVNLTAVLEISVLLIQKEVAERITSAPPKANYMSSYLGTFLSIEIVEVVDRYAFDPVPEVDGAIVKLKPLKNPLISAESAQRYSRFLHHGFGQPRKMLNKRFSKELLKEAGIDHIRRAETLKISEWVTLFEKFKSSPA